MQRCPVWVLSLIFVAGNKPILLARLKEYYNEREGPKTESGTDTEDPETSELSGEEDSQLSPEDIRANEERDKVGSCYK